VIAEKGSQLVMAGRHTPRSVRAELFLIAHDEVPGFRPRYRPRISTTILGAGLAGALVVDLLLADQVRIAQGQVNFHHARRHGNDPIAEELARQLAAAHDWLPLREVIAGLAHGLYERTVIHLIDQNVITATAPRFGRTRYRPTDPAHAARALAHPRMRIRDARQGPPVLDPATDALGALIGALHLEDSLYLEFTTLEVSRRIEILGHWLSRAAAEDQQLAAIPDVVAAVETVAGDLAVAVYR